MLSGLSFPVSDDLIVGADTADDAGVFRLDKDTGIVFTVDFFTPIVDDYYRFGEIAAANALSDVYAMGGRPLAALNICAFPPKENKKLLGRILQGGADKIREAGAVIAGGHSVRDEDLKYGLAIIGHVHPDKIKTNGDARPGDKLVLTKPIGTGLLSTARRKDAIEEKDFETAVLNMLSLNKTASEIMVSMDAGGCTDITGFGLLGHAYEMAAASDVALEIQADLVPLLDRVKWCAKEGHSPGGAKNNYNHFICHVDGRPTKDYYWNILFDPQTSGGLLVSIAPGSCDEFMDRLKNAEINASVVGSVKESPQGRIIIK